ncbi:hypothetical protein PoB_007624700 [Plakobranchus ocellatus]|uniref:EF-hand domain-containing protein n=1 Tax=Plakobranchus ocellatus TaxID=259542 RepID=A0AAV4DZF4_9GAST|nr:hypothetical protein PoB_007624700 [Plakobranchus ocellatus]
MASLHTDSNAIVGLIVILAFGTMIHTSEGVDVNAPKDLFHFGDKDNSSSLSMAECSQMWLSLDVDGDKALSKIEFLFRWKFGNFPDSESAPLFLRLVDDDFDGYVSQEEIGKLCSFFDDDGNGFFCSFLNT